MARSAAYMASLWLTHSTRLLCKRSQDRHRAIARPRRQDGKTCRTLSIAIFAIISPLLVSEELVYATFRWQEMVRWRLLA